MPARRPQRLEADPERAVREQPRATQVRREEAFAVRDTFLLARLIQSRAPPRLLAAFDDKRATVAGEGVGVDLEEAVLALAEHEREAVQQQVAAKPDELRAPRFDPRPK